MPQCQAADLYGWQSCIEQIKAARYIASVPDGRLYGWQSCVDQYGSKIHFLWFVEADCMHSHRCAVAFTNTSGQAVAEAAL